MQKKDKDFSGQVGDLSPKQEEVLGKLKKFIQEKDYTKKIYDDWYLLRFCKAQDWKEKKVIEVFENFHKIREHNKCDLILQYDLSEFSNKVDLFLQKHHTGWDRQGYPVSYIKILNSDPKLFDNMKPGFATLYALRLMEQANHVIYPYMTALTKKRIDKDTVIIDVGGIKDISSFLSNDKVKLIMRIFADVSDKMYPDNSSLVHIINAPIVMKTFWPLISAFVPERSKSGILIHGKDYQKELLKYIDKKYLPDFVGGDINNWPNNKLPWDDYLNYCIERKTYFHDESMKIGDPLEVIKKNPLDRTKIAEFLKKKKEANEAAQKKQAATGTKATDSPQKKPVQTTAKATESPKKIQN